MNNNFIRIIPKLDIKNGNLIKGINLEGLRIIGDPYNFANYYASHGADEITYQDNVAALYGTNNLDRYISKTAIKLRIPLTVGGGIRSIKDIERVLSAGADKVCLNSAIIKNNNFLKNAIKNFGSSTISIVLETVSIGNKEYISYLNGRELVNIKPIDWAKKVEDLGAGELILTSVNKEGLRKGFDLKTINQISKSVKIPVIAHGGAGNFMQILNVIKKTNISGVMIASLFHYHYLNFVKSNISKKIGNIEFLKNFKTVKVKQNLITELKSYLKQNKVNVRL
tara:strand:+ start:236 stop:1081 length:846 start_codon:yes stop_codon:yes gene_type:complete